MFGCLVTGMIERVNREGFMNERAMIKTACPEFCCQQYLRTSVCHSSMFEAAREGEFDFFKGGLHFQVIIE